MSCLGFSKMFHTLYQPLPSQVPMYTPGWREAIIVKYLAQGHKCHDRDSNPPSGELAPELKFDALNHSAVTLYGIRTHTLVDWKYWRSYQCICPKAKNYALYTVQENFVNVSDNIFSNTIGRLDGLHSLLIIDTLYLNQSRHQWMYIYLYICCSKFTDNVVSQQDLFLIISLG